MELGDNGDLASVKKKKTKNITQLTLLKN